MIRAANTFGYRQQGAIMVVSLLLLLIMTVLALGASQATRMQERMAGNARDHDLALQSAEAGVRAAERVVKGMTSAPPTCSTGRCPVFELGIPDAASTTALPLRDNTWWNANAWRYDASSNFIMSAGMARQDPEYMIEEYEVVYDTLTIPPTGAAPNRTHYRITSRGVGGSNTTAVVIQSTWARRF